MKTAIESIICNWADEIPHILIRVINAVALSANEEELRTAIRKIAEETKLDEFFAYGYGAHDFWLTHRRLSNGEPMPNRLLKVESTPPCPMKRKIGHSTSIRKSG